MDFQGSEINRQSNDISDARNQKRRRLNDHSFQESSPCDISSHGSADPEETQNADVFVRSGGEAYDDRCKTLECDVDSPGEPMGDNGSSVCCYGMLTSIPVRLRSPANLPKSQLANIPVTLRAPNVLSSIDNVDSGSADFELQSLIYQDILNQFNGLKEIATQMYCFPVFEPHSQPASRTSKRRSSKRTRGWHLNVILYGIVALEEAVGRYLSKKRIYLQDPMHCDRNVLYMNPHMISHSGELVTTDSFKAPPPAVEVERLRLGPDLLAQLMADQGPLLETEPPSTITTNLFRHQKQALTFMMTRERGWDFESNRDIWTTQTSQVECSLLNHSSKLYAAPTHMLAKRYCNTINGHCQNETPPCFRGGLLADDMGLGKTLSMISLIVSDQQPKASPGMELWRGCTQFQAHESTLLIVPPPLIQTWESQLAMHIHPGTFRTCIYHGQNKKEIEHLHQYDIVITTFQTLSSIWRKQSLQGFQDPLFSTVWRRVILDEAHIIQNAKSQLSQACCAIKAERRWAITGTPIQNKLSDFASILKFLQVHPYCDQKTFDEDISRPWHAADREGFFRLKSLVRAITISRTKTVIDLPDRVDEIHHLEFSPQEREGYSAANRDTIALFEEAICSGEERGKAFNALTRLNFLRIFCNLGLLVHRIHASKGSAALLETSNTPAQSMDFDTLDSDVPMKSATCAQCSTALSEDLFEGALTPSFEQPPSTACSIDVCENCKLEMPASPSAPATPFQYDYASIAQLSSFPSTPSDEPEALVTVDSMPSKIKALVADLSKHTPSEKCVVFSFWTSTLDLIQQVLNGTAITYARIDGKTPLTKRSEAMRSFQNDDFVRVILVSITCGGAGIDLTAASRAYLLEPQWNPMIEEQALCRVHRVGQRKKVTTIRYLMRNSFEEQVSEIQKRKRKLAEVTFGPGQLSEDGIKMGTLVYLRSVLE